MCGHRRHSRRSSAAAPSRARRGFTLAEVLMAMMVSGMILGAVATLSVVLGTYNNEGDGMLSLATNGRFAVTLLGRDIRSARAMTVSSTGGLILWMGDLNDDGQMDCEEFVVYYKPSGAGEIRRMASQGNAAIGPVSAAVLQSIANTFDAGMIVVTAQGMGLTVQNEVVCRNVDSLAFYANRPISQTLTVEFLITLSGDQNTVEGSGRTVELTLYDSATMRAPYEEGDFDPQT